MTHCSSCGEDSDLVYRCTNCGRDLVDTEPKRGRQR